MNRRRSTFSRREFLGHAAGMAALGFGASLKARDALASGYYDLMSSSLMNLSHYPPQSVFSMGGYTGNGNSSSGAVVTSASFTPDLIWIKSRTAAGDHFVFDTVRGPSSHLALNQQYLPSTSSYPLILNSNGFAARDSGNVNMSGTNYISWMFKKAPGFFDIVQYSGTGTDGRLISHGLKTQPGLVLIKQITQTANHWYAWVPSCSSSDAITTSYSGGFSGASPTFWGASGHTSTQLNLNSNPSVNSAGVDYIAYLFAGNVPGLIRCGSYSASGASVTVTDPGFSPRFLMIRNVNTGDWEIYDAMRGVSSPGNDARLFLGGTPATSSETSVDGVDFISGKGFIVKSSALTSAGTYFYMAIA